MNAPVRISTQIDAVTLARIEAAAAALGITLEQFAGDVLRRAAEEAVDLADRLRVGRAQIASGDAKDHDAFRADLRRWQDERVRPH
jgi:uncharacterized protein (DUF1778 family)